MNIPRSLRQRPRWNDLPLPYTVFVGPDGIPDFKVIDEVARSTCLRRHLCGLCGQPLGKEFVLIGGPKSVENRAFIDPPNHPDCALYAAATCPYLNNPDHGYSKKDPKHLGMDSVVNRTYEEVDFRRPAKMAMYYTTGYTLVQHKDAVHIRPYAPTKIDWTTIAERVE